jgi:hypothetical protein
VTAAGWPDPFDAPLYAAQRNTRDFLVSVFVALTREVTWTVAARP